MRYSYIVYKRDSFNPEDRGLRLGVIVQGENTVIVKFSKHYTSHLKEYDPNYDKFIVDNLPFTLSNICSQKTFTVSSAEGGEILTTDPRFLTELRKLYRSRIQISTPKIVESSDSKIDKVAESVGV